MMRTIKLGSSSLEVPVIAVGCMRINSLEKTEAERFVQSALEEGANFFDHADIYGGGTCEEIFADAIHMNAEIREKIILQSKCGIRKGMFDFSKEYILESVDGILKRLNTEYLDVLLLHARMRWSNLKRLPRPLIPLRDQEKCAILVSPIKIRCRSNCFRNL